LRKALNDNPAVQIGVLAALAVLVGFLFLTRLHGSTSSAPTDTTAVPTDTTSSLPAAPATSAPSTAPAPEPSSPASAFRAGPGLPAAVVKAYDSGDVVVLLVTKHGSLDDRALRADLRVLDGRPGLSVFTTNAKNVADYSRIAEGVDVHQAPALVVLRPKHLAGKGTMPEASVEYGFRSVDSVDQAIRDALYKGPTNLPFYP
jgi:hypothetical protein